MEQNFKCTGNCLNCLPAQRAYCASQHAYSNMKVLDAMMQEVLNMKNDIKALSDRIEAIQNNEASIFDPNEEKSEIPTLPTAEVASAAREKTAEIINN